MEIGGLSPYSHAKVDNGQTKNTPNLMFLHDSYIQPILNATSIAPQSQPLLQQACNYFQMNP